MDPRSAARPTVALSAIAMVLAAPLCAQKASLDRDIDFVRDLATKLRFISLAQSEVDRMKIHYKRRADNLAVDMLGVEVSLIGAKSHPNREEKRTLYKDAIDRCKTILEAVTSGSVALSARMTLADATREFGAFLSEEVELARVEAPDKVTDLETEAAEVFQAGEDACDAVTKELEGKKDSDQRAARDYYVTWMVKGILLREHARAVKKDRKYLADRSRDTLEELILDIGEDTVLGQRALFEYAQNDEVIGDFDSAIQGYKDVVDSANTSLTDEEIDIPLAARERMVETIEEAYARIASTHFAQGQIDKVNETLKTYREHLEKLDVPLTNLDDPEAELGKEDQRFGHSLYVTAARAMAESGDDAQVAKALKLVQFFNQKHPSDLVGIRAKAALKEILAARSSKVSGVLLLEVAKGEYQAKSWEPAVRGLKQAVAAMTPVELSSHGLEAYYLMGHSLALQNRLLESTHALATGLEAHGASADDPTKEKATGLIQRTLRQVRTNSKNDKYFDGLAAKVDALIIQHGSALDASKRKWNDGRRMMSDRDYDGAIRAFKQITKDALHYEWAQARLAASQQRKNDFKAARQTIADYRKFLGTPQANIPDERADKRHVRKIAIAEVAFSEGYMVYQEALGGGKGPKDLTKFPEVIKLLSDFDAQHGKDAPNLVSHVYYVLGRSYVEMGNLEKAEEKYRTLQKTHPTDSNVPRLGTALFSAYEAQVTAKKVEVDQLEKKKEQAAMQRAEQELAKLRGKTMALGIEYFESSDKPQYGIAYLTLKQAQALRDWTRVESLGSKVVSTFENQAKVKSKVDKFVRPIVAAALLEQHKYRQAHDLLVAAEKASPKNYEVKRLICRCLGGWQEIDQDGRVQRYAGLGRPAEAYQKYWTEYKTAGLNKVERYSLPWYEFYWELYHYALAASADDSEFVSRAKTVYSKAQSTDNFKHLQEKLGRRGNQLYNLFFENPPR